MRSEGANPDSTPAIRILGIDPGLRITGFGIIEKTGTKLAYLTSGCVRTPADGALPLRLKSILDGLREVIATHRPQQVAVELQVVGWVGEDEIDAGGGQLGQLLEAVAIEDLVERELRRGTSYGAHVRCFLGLERQD